MKFRTMLFVSFLLSALNSNSQSHSKGDVNFNIGSGFAPYYAPSNYNVIMRPITFGADVSYFKSFSFGSFFSYCKTESDQTNLPYLDDNFLPQVLSYKVKANYLVSAIRIAYHFSTSEKWDPYVGIMSGYVYAYESIETNTPALKRLVPDENSSHVIAGIYLGARYYFHNDFSLNGEIGLGNLPFQLGFSYRLRKD